MIKLIPESEYPYGVTKDVLGGKERFTFPFKTRLTFKYLIEYLESQQESENRIKSFASSKILEIVKKYPEFMDIIEDDSILIEHKEILEVLMSAVFPIAQWESQIAAANIPFMFKPFYVTPAFKRIIGDYTPEINGKSSMETHATYLGKTLSAFTVILFVCYNYKIKFSHPFIITFPDKKTGLNRYFQLNIDTRFTRVVPTKELKPLTDEDFEKLKKNVMDLALWQRLIPPENFEIHGFSIVYAIDVTEQEVLSSLKHDLLEKETIISQERFSVLEQKLKNLFRLPDIKLGLVSFPNKNELFMQVGIKIGGSLICNERCKTHCNDLYSSVYDKALINNKPMVVEDLAAYKEKGAVEKHLLSQGIKSLIIAPLNYKKDAVGFLELGSPNSDDLTEITAIKLSNVLSLFSMAVKRSMDERENNIQTIIKEKCTAIHPSVEWKFRNAAVNLITRSEKDPSAEIEPIVFENVFPLYGLSDIRNSSLIRIDAIRADLIEQLGMVKSIIESAQSYKQLPYLDELNYRLQKNIQKIKAGLNSGDEVNIHEFFHNEVEAALVHIGEFTPLLKESVKNYKAALDPVLKVLYKKRKDFEESLNLINTTISDYLDEADDEAQAMFPHYFEKYKTDGVEHSMYIGHSIAPAKKFDLLYLKNLRLFQLLLVCTIGKLTHQLIPKLKLPLETTHLILVQNNPLSIRFRFDEKKFDVDGAYNIRYEIMKKRIDKAHIKGGKDRLTAPGKIAIVYTQTKEAAEYKRYIEYLQSIGCLTNYLEDVELEELQGIYGLRALRVEINLSGKSSQKFPERFPELVGSIQKIHN